jgi:hypothetical protein
MTAHHCPSFPCPICYPHYSYPPHYPTHPYSPGFYSAPAPKGCICPPGSEKTCQGLGCPRKGISVASAATSPDGSAKRRDVKQARPEGQQPEKLHKSGSKAAP